MGIRGIAVAILLCVSGAAQALLSSDYEKTGLAQALERARADGRHVMVYFGLETFCPPCKYTRDLLSGSALVAAYRTNFHVVEFDLRNPGEEGRAAATRYGARWAPTLVFLSPSGKKIARMPKGFRNEREALLTGEFVARKHYLRSDLEPFLKANFDAAGAERVFPEKRVAGAAGRDDRPRLRDVLGQKHERIAGEDLRKLLPGARMEKENQDWFLTLRLAPDGGVDATGTRKGGRDKMKGPGKWYVTKKGKLCVEVKGGGADETWCRHVFRVGDGNYYYAVKDLRPERLAYRFTLEKT